MRDKRSVYLYFDLPPNTEEVRPPLRLSADQPPLSKMKRKKTGGAVFIGNIDQKNTKECQILPIIRQKSSYHYH